MKKIVCCLNIIFIKVQKVVLNLKLTKINKFYLIDKYFERMYYIKLFLVKQLYKYLNNYWKQVKNILVKQLNDLLYKV